MLGGVGCSGCVGVELGVHGGGGVGCCGVEEGGRGGGGGVWFCGVQSVCVRECMCVCVCVCVCVSVRIKVEGCWKGKGGPGEQLVVVHKKACAGVVFTAACILCVLFILTPFHLDAQD